MKACLPHLWLRDTWSVDPALQVVVCRNGEVVKTYWCNHLDPLLVKPILLFRVLELSGLSMQSLGLLEWTVTTSDGWRFDGFEKLEDPKETRCES